MIGLVVRSLVVLLRFWGVDFEDDGVIVLSKGLELSQSEQEE
jgi:hypothetical protein